MNFSTPESFDIKFVRQGPLFRYQRRFRLIKSDHELSIGRRIFIAILITWVPIMVFALLQGQLFHHADPLLRHFGVHSRCLIAIPLLILAEGLAESLMPMIVEEFAKSGLVGEEQIPAFRQAIENAKSLLDSLIAFIVIVVGSMLIAVVALRHISDIHEIAWAIDPPGQDLGSLGLAGWWFVLVSRPIFCILVGCWLWRLVCLFVFFRSVTKLDLTLAPTHPDQVGGLGFLEEAVVIFVPVVLALSVVLASNWAHNVLYHDVHVVTLKSPAILYVILVLGVFLSPWLAFMPALKKFGREARFAYGALLVKHGQLVDRRWIKGEALQQDGLLSAPEIGPIADVASIYAVVEGIRTVPLRKKAVIQLAVAALLPLIPVYAIEVPIKNLLKQLAGALFV